jgi:hypothetical protein
VTPYVQCDHVTPTDVVATARALLKNNHSMFIEH